MHNQGIVEKIYTEAVKGIKNEWFSTNSTNWYDYIVSLPLKYKVVYVVMIMNNQVLNGGFHQYFVNGYGQFVKETIAALIDIGAYRSSDILERAYSVVNVNNVSLEIFRQELLSRKLEPLFVSNELYKPLDTLDNEYCEIEDENIEELLTAYLMRNS